MLQNQSVDVRACYIFYLTLNTESDTACLFPTASKLAGSNMTNDPLPKRWVPWDGLYVVSSLIQVFM